MLTKHRTINSSSSDTSKKEELSVQISNSPPIPQIDQLRPEGLRFDRLQPPNSEFVQEDRLEFGKFVAREAILDEEFWVSNEISILDSEPKNFVLRLIVFMLLRVCD